MASVRGFPRFLCIFDSEANSPIYLVYRERKWRKLPEAGSFQSRHIALQHVGWKEGKLQAGRWSCPGGALAWRGGSRR